MKRTSTLKAILFLSCLLNINFAWSQKQSRLPKSGVQSADGCLACPGSEWNDASKITQVDGQSATTTMTENGFCFQTVCFYTRGLIGSDFGFNIPVTAAIDGIVVRVNRKADIVQTVKDSFVQLLSGFTPIGVKKKANVFWPTTAAVRTYGSPTDLWGKVWTPSDINSSDFGVWLKCYNKSSKQPQASVDYIKITVYYEDGGKVKSQEVSYVFDSENLGIYPNPSDQIIKVDATVNTSGPVSISVMNMAGVVLMNFEEIATDNFITREIDISSLPQGGYLIRLQSSGQIMTRTFLKE